MEDQTISEIIPLQTRKYSCFFQTSTGFLRRVKSSGVEVIRAIYGAVRDKNWDTVEPRLEIKRIEQGDDSFSLHFTAHHENEPISFSWKGTIEGRGGVLEFTFDGRAEKIVSFGIESVFACCIQSSNAQERLAGCSIQTARGKRDHFRDSFLLINPLRTFKRFRGILQIVSKRVFGWRVKSLKWKTSEIGQTLR